MNRRLVGLFLVGLVAGIVAVWAVLAAQPTIAGLTGAYCLAPRCYCDGPQFEAAVYQGPDAGLEVEGQIKYSVNPDGTFDVQIRDNSGALVKGTGQAVGRSLDMVLVLPDDRHVYAHGALDDDLRRCNGGAAGPLTGPSMAILAIGAAVTRRTFARSAVLSIRIARRTLSVCHHA